MLWRRGDLERAGGIEALASEVAEDAAATKVVRAQLPVPDFGGATPAKRLRQRLVEQAHFAPGAAHDLGRCGIFCNFTG